MDSIRANSHAVFETGFDICYKPELDKKWILSGLTIMQYLKPDLIYVTNQSWTRNGFYQGLQSCSVWNRIWYLLQTRARQEMDSIRANNHAVFETRFDICYKPELNKKWILSGLTVMQCLKPDLISVANQS